MKDARRNPDAFLSYCFTDPANRPLRQGQVHRELQTFLSEHPKALVEMPRDHGKSTQVCARLVWELARDPSLRIKIVCGSEALAAERGRFIREAIEKSERLRMVFPNLQPDHPWSDTRLTVVRPANVIGPSIAAIGIGAVSTGTRADLLVCDDIVDVKALHSRAERDRVKDHFRGLCTPWHGDDLNAELKRNDAYPLFRRAIGDDLNPVWPERWPREALQARRTEIGEASFTRGYRLVPLAEGTMMIPLETVKYWDRPLEPDRVVLSIDPAISVDPRADCSALVVLAQIKDEVRCLDAVARRVSTSDLVTWIGAVDSVWNPSQILFETNGAFDGIADLIKHHTSFGFKLVRVRQSKSKESRVGPFSACVSSGKFQLKGDGTGRVDPGQQALLDEMTTFPVGEHDDLLDAAAMGAMHLLNTREPRGW